MLLNNSLLIRQEVQRFESVHPSIYAIYDLIELIQDNQIAQQIRDHVVCIEGELCICFSGHLQFLVHRTVAVDVNRRMRYSVVYNLNFIICTYYV